MDPIQTIALSMGTAWASGINLYATVLMLALMNATGGIELPPELAVVNHPVVITAAAVMFFIEFFADKIPGVDSTWDALHTFIRIPAGAILAAQAVGDVSAPWELTAALLGGSLAATSHATKASARLMINTSPEPVTNWTASFTEDFLVIAGMWTALHYPWLFLIALAIMVGLMAWLLPKIWRQFRRIFTRLFRSPEQPASSGT